MIIKEKNAINWFDRDMDIEWARSSKWKKEIKCNNIIKCYKKMINFADDTKKP